ncbi:hypothetical protein Acin_1814 [Acidaminococcus intestini RyC-MR95]|uniref:Uncharacterized protein n=1 Tax=Acidaminococcus intestini (strain RyC-MR95) TaxID=568816 RepID=G4Q3V9_ACIIR|nr:hypothetical protein Acin_1814 [Acidaminococcus intestini RyC-MR95]
MHWGIRLWPRFQETLPKGKVKLGGTTMLSSLQGGRLFLLQERSFCHAH